MIDLHGDLAGILTIANGKASQAGARGGKSADYLEGDAYAVWRLAEVWPAG